MSFDEPISDPALGLCLGVGPHDQSSDHKTRQRHKGQKKNIEEDPCNLSLGPPPPDDEKANMNQLATKTTTELDEYCFHHPQQYASSPSVVYSSFSHSSTSIKRERDQFAGEDFDLDQIEKKIDPSRVNVDAIDENGSSRKKLRLTKEQSAILEDNFKQHSTLTPKQKQELARKLNLRARQVEVWFQNRRARTKLKQTEVDYELLKKCWETLTEENKRLQKELQEIKSSMMKSSTAHGPAFYMQLPVASLSMCPSCSERICCGSSATGNGSSSPITALLIGSKSSTQHHLYKNNYQFTQTSHLVSLEG